MWGYDGDSNYKALQEKGLVEPFQECSVFQEDLDTYFGPKVPRLSVL